MFFLRTLVQLITLRFPGWAHHLGLTLGALDKNSQNTDSASSQPGPRDTNFLQKYLKQF